MHPLRRISEQLGWMAPYICGFIFLYSGLNKVFNPTPSVMALRAGMPISYSLADFLVYLVCVVELYVAVTFLFAEWKTAGFVLATTCLGVFAIFLAYIATMANPPECGCGRLFALFDSNHKNAIFGIVRNLSLLGLLWLYSRSRIIEETPTRNGPVAVA